MNHAERRRDRGDELSKMGLRNYQRLLFSALHLKPVRLGTANILPALPRAIFEMRTGDGGLMHRDSTVVAGTCKHHQSNGDVCHCSPYYNVEVYGFKTERNGCYKIWPRTKQDANHVALALLT